MSEPLPSYTQSEINRVFAFAFQVGYEHLSGTYQTIIRNVASDMYVLKPEDDDQKG